MKTNLGLIDRAVRMVLAVGLIYLVYILTISSQLSTILIIMAGVFLITGSIGYCPFYVLFGISTNKKKY